jgi:hypothetical protein
VKSPPISILLAVLIAGCSAGINHVPIAYPGTADQPQGIRYYASARYLLVYSDSKGGIKAKILTLPDQTRLMEARPWGSGSSLKTSLSFKNGVLTESSEEVDATATSSAILSAAQTILPLLAASKTDNRVPAPYLYKILVQGSKVSFIGGTDPNHPIEVKLSEEKKKEGAE